LGPDTDYLGGPFPVEHPVPWYKSLYEADTDIFIFIVRDATLKLRI